MNSCKSISVAEEWSQILRTYCCSCPPLGSGNLFRNVGCAFVAWSAPFAAVPPTMPLSPWPLFAACPAPAAELSPPFCIAFNSDNRYFGALTYPWMWSFECR